MRMSYGSCWYVTCHGMVCSYAAAAAAASELNYYTSWQLQEFWSPNQTQKLDRVGKPRGLTFSMLSTRKETVQIYWRKTIQETCKKTVPSIALP